MTMDDRPYITYEGIYILGADGIQITPECIDEDVEAPLAILPDDRKILVCEWEKINCGDGKATTGGTTEIQLWSGFLVAESQPGLFKAMQDSGRSTNACARSAWQPERG
ncbi:hypothetical protein HNP46_006359 [Pseudomonas nitritireducens]|uniref:Uncharacterized protein n=1 Tax=Pseudomonas nitroreducens TaxID=46680 RepID=A0A7W7KRD7_PSENT|nr:hypothetical protein [Pseudomonas nitritireducens]MBB4867446.1 hypothetical protein [Pseudomonas nitritireducens]